MREETMSQAVLILAHKDFDQVHALAKHLKPYFGIYIHFDSKNKLTPEQISQFEDDGFYCFQKYEINWGAWSICRAMLLLLEEAYRNTSNNYFHFISGQDWPVGNPKKIYEFYENNSSIYLRWRPAKIAKETGEPIELWQKYYFNYDKIARQSLFGVLYHRYTLLKQTLKHVNKFNDLDIPFELYQGSQWSDLPRDAAQYCLKFLEDNPNYQKMLETGFCSDEFLIQSILCNSSLKDRIINDNHRFIKLKKQHGSYPAILDSGNLTEIVSGNFHFARKIDLTHSKSLIEKLNQL